MSKSIKRNYVYSTMYNILMVLSPLITTPYISRVLEADGIGAASFAASIASYFILFSDMGTGSYGKREISYVRDDPEKRSIIFWETQILRVINTLIALAVYIALVLLYAKTYRAIFLVFTINILCVAFDIAWFLAGLEEFGKIVAKSSILRIIDITFVFLFIKSKSDLTLHVFVCKQEYISII